MIIRVGYIRVVIMVMIRRWWIFVMICILGRFDFVMVMVFDVVCGSDKVIFFVEGLFL